MSKTIKEMTAEIDEYSADKGWRDPENPVTFGERIALLHSEVSEALEAWRAWGLADATNRDHGRLGGHYEDPPKPEGVGAEFADVLIRLVDDAFIAGVDLEAAVELFGSGRFGLREKFGEQINTLHLLTSMLYMKWEDSEFETLGPRSSVLGGAFARVYVYLTQLCELHGIDLEAEYERKMAYNRSRPYRHGGKPI